MFEPLWNETQKLLIPLGLAAMVTVSGYLAPSPLFFIVGLWAIVVTVALAVIRSLPKDKP